MNVSVILKILLVVIALTAKEAVSDNASVSAAFDGEFTTSYEIAETVLERSGVGVLTYLGFIRIYRGVIYLPPEVSADRVLEDVPKRLEVVYLRSFEAEEIGRAAIVGIRKNVTPELFAQLDTRIAYHNSLYENVVQGDRVSLTYHPLTGTRVEINGRTKGAVRGADFAKALFSLWLGENPFDPEFKKSLLGDRR